MAITGTHMLLYSPQADELRGVLKDVFGFAHVDAGDGWLIFKLPPAELGVHPAGAPSHELTFMCDDLDSTVVELTERGIMFEGEPVEAGFGKIIYMLLPGDVKVMLYEPHHPTAS